LLISGCFRGSLKNRDTILNFSQQTEEKVSQIKKAFTNKLEDIPELTAGDIGIISGLPNVKVGDILGSDKNVPKNNQFKYSIAYCSGEPC
jgi:ribosomal protection tetracycline resistance protein